MDYPIFGILKKLCTPAPPSNYQQKSEFQLKAIKEIFMAKLSLRENWRILFRFWNADP